MGARSLKDPLWSSGKNIRESYEGPDKISWYDEKTMYAVLRNNPDDRSLRKNFIVSELPKNFYDLRVII